MLKEGVVVGGRVEMGGEVYKTAEEDVVVKEAEERLSDEEMVAAVGQGQNKYSVLGGVTGVPPPLKVVVVGYALTSKKVKSFLQPKLEGLARYYFFLKKN